MRLFLAVILFLNTSNIAFAGDMSYRKDAPSMPGYNTGTGRFVDEDRTFVFEADAYTPAKASRSANATNKVQEWGAEFQYNLIDFFLSTEFWFGEYKKAGHSATGASLNGGEAYKIFYNRYQFFIGRFSKKEHMNGWYAKGGYSFTKVDTDATLIDSTNGTGVSTYNTYDDSRQGMTASAGHRFTFFKNYCSLNLGLSYTKTTSRTLTDQHPRLESRYESILANAGDKRLSSKDFPELRLAVGILF